MQEGQFSVHMVNMVKYVSENQTKGTVPFVWNLMQKVMQEGQSLVHLVYCEANEGVINIVWSFWNIY